MDIYLLLYQYFNFFYYEYELPITKYNIIKLYTKENNVKGKIKVIKLLKVIIRIVSNILTQFL